MSTGLRTRTVERAAMPKLHDRVALQLMVAAPCQNDCRGCALEGIRKHDPDYQLSMKQLKHVICCSRSSGYKFLRVWICGPGEPMLWRHLNEGLALLHESGIARRLSIATNGLALENLDEDIARLPSIGLRVSIYPQQREAQREIFRKYRALSKGRFSVINKRTFSKQPEDEIPIPCRCLCPGPTVYGDYVLPSCGAVCFSAAARMGRSVFEFDDVIQPLSPNFLKALPVTGESCHELCKFCFGNSNFARIGMEHQCHVGRR